MSVRRYTVYNLIGASLPIAVSFLTVPAYFHLVGEIRFGILSIAWLFLGYFGLFDLGLGMATTRQVAAREKDGRHVQAQIFWTALLTNLSLGLAGAIIAWPVAHFYFGHMLKVSPGMRFEIIAAIPWLVLAVPVATVTGVVTGALQGINRFGTLNLISFLGSTLFQLLPLAAAFFWSPSLNIVLPISLLAQALSLAMLGFECYRHLLRGHAVTYDRAELKVLFRFGFWVAVSAFFSPLMTMVDRLIIGAYVSAAAVSLYVVPFNLGQRLCILGNAMGVALFPRIAAASFDEALMVEEEAERVLSAIMLVAIVGAIFIIGPFLRIWIGQDFAFRASAIAEVLLLGVWFEAVSRIPLYALRGLSRPEVIAKIDLIQLVPFWIALLVLITKLGALGVAIAYVFRVGANYALLVYEVGTLRRLFPILATSVVMLVLSLTLVRLVSPLSMPWFAALLGCGSLSAALAFWYLPNRVRGEVVGRMIRLRARA